MEKNVAEFLEVKSPIIFDAERVPPATGLEDTVKWTKRVKRRPACVGLYIIYRFRHCGSRGTGSVAPPRRSRARGPPQRTRRTAQVLRQCDRLLPSIRKCILLWNVFPGQNENNDNFEFPMIVFIRDQLDEDRTKSYICCRHNNITLTRWNDKNNNVICMGANNRYYN